MMSTYVQLADSYFIAMGSCALQLCLLGKEICPQMYIVQPHMPVCYVYKCLYFIYKLLVRPLSH